MYSTNCLPAIVANLTLAYSIWPVSMLNLNTNVLYNSSVIKLVLDEVQEMCFMWQGSHGIIWVCRTSLVWMLEGLLVLWILQFDYSIWEPHDGISLNLWSDLLIGTTFFNLSSMGVFKTMGPQAHHHNLDLLWLTAWQLFARAGKKRNRMFRINFVFCTIYLRIGLATRYSHELNHLVRLVLHVQVHLIVPKSANAGRQMNATPWLWSAHTLHTHTTRKRARNRTGWEGLLDGERKQEKEKAKRSTRQAASWTGQHGGGTGVPTRQPLSQKNVD